jgi:transposase InsO family protein
VKPLTVYGCCGKGHLPALLRRSLEPVQYTGRAFRDACLSNGIIPSVGHTGICFDNAAAESWNATFKKELIHLHAWKNVAHVKQAAFEYVEVYYNRKRIQKRLGYLSPSEFELGVDMGMALTA